MPRAQPFDAVLIIAFGGPEGMADIRPFLANVLRGRRIPSERVEEVAHHYELFGGVSPLNALTRQQAAGLETRLAARGLALPVYVGMRNWHPMLADTMASMLDRGVRRALGFIAAPHKSYSSCGQYKQNVMDARAQVNGGASLTITYVDVFWHNHPGFVEANAEYVTDALDRLPASLRERARIVFTAHSLPTSMAQGSPYVDQLMETARLVAARLQRADWALVFQSRSGRPEDPWLGPDIVDYLRAERAAGLEAVVVSPIGFLCDHIEVLYDLDHEAAAVCREIGLPMARASTVNTHPAFLDAITDVVDQTITRYAGGRPLPLVAAPPPETRRRP